MNINVYGFQQKQKWLADFEKARFQILDGNDKKKQNYSEKNLNINEQDQASVVYINEELAGFSFVLTRPLWKNNSRVLNRYYILPKFRNNFFRSSNIFSKLMLDHQTAFAKKMLRDCVFISRERPAIGWIRQFLKKNPNWKSDPNSLFEVCEAKNLQCWQHCVWLNLEKNCDFSLNKRSVADFSNHMDSND